MFLGRCLLAPFAACCYDFHAHLFSFSFKTAINSLPAISALCLAYQVCRRKSKDKLQLCMLNELNWLIIFDYKKSGLRHVFASLKLFWSFKFLMLFKFLYAFRYRMHAWILCINKRYSFSIVSQLGENLPSNRFESRGVIVKIRGYKLKAGVYPWMYMI